ncbi:penicillin acylase family protein [Jeotgalibacillus proteolyticus]|uniref:Penicillin acylase family protein n=1 Tax=Jeotgalibacillus proteolyticus TaxID=2082395 RepID=A0A2S5G934_9BACL|nr:penicillin acylase family protein [Jeotgalibacillus proteolyticus]PPA69512.1 penicillin acylase family protein [Jeotgalibacillus proteolyticus]
MRKIKENQAEPSRKGKRGLVKKSLLWFGVIVAVLLIGGFLFINWYVGRSLAVIEGELEVPVLSETVTVTRDADGVPHIEARSEADLYRAQGFVQAQDRLFQMDLARRQASGRLSEVVGDAALSTDQFFRSFSLRHAAELSYDGYGDEAKDVLAWYAEGVNAYMEAAEENGTLPFEFRILGYKPEEWTEIDSLTIGKYMAYDLGGNWSTLAFRHWATGEFPEDKARELFITYPENAPAIIEANKEQKVQVAGEFIDAPIPHPFNGSNNWVVSGDRTESGMPLLADDPHLGLGTPSIWYQMHLTSPEQNVSGVIFAGIPGIILGHNDEIAWGVTNVGPDVQDLYIEQPNPENPNQFLYEGEWVDAEVRDEPIGIKGEDPVDFQVVTTRHGPIISTTADGEEGPAFSMQWTALEPTLELQAVLNMNKASNWDEFEQALEDFHSPAQNFVFAAKDGTIAYKANGRIPIRKTGDGQLPVPGDSGDYEWTGYVPYGELPTVVNPDSGFIATANNAVVDDSYPYHITDFWAQPYRYKRIVEVLEENDAVTAEDMMALQMDQKNLYAEEFLDSMIATVRRGEKGEEFKEELDLLEEWNRVDDKKEAAPLLFHLWIKELPIVLFNEEMPKDVLGMFSGKNHVTDQMMRDAFGGDEGVWVSEYGGVEKWLTDSFSNVQQAVTKEFGDDLSKWQWGDYHQVYFEHPLSGASPVLKWLFNREDPIPVGGSQITVQAASYGPDGIVDHGGSWRFVADLSDLSKAYHIVGPGQAGHIKSPWYQDQIDDWVKGNYHETVIDQEQVTGDTLTLKP